MSVAFFCGKVIFIWLETACTFVDSERFLIHRVFSFIPNVFYIAMSINAA